MPLLIGFYFPEPQHMHSGHSWLLNMMACNASNDVMSSVIVTHAGVAEKLSHYGFPCKEMILPRRYSFRWAWHAMVRRMSRSFAHRQDEAWALSQMGLRAFVGCTFSTPYAGLPLVSWIPDFQHLHLPEMFSASEIRSRDRQFAAIAQGADRVLLMSESVKQDFCSVYPQYTEKAIVIPTLAFVPDSAYQDSPELIAEQYHLPERFVYVPNQFWKHKNHLSIVRALKILQSENCFPVVVCSGRCSDYRHPEYFADLLTEINTSGVHDQVFILGVVPRNHVFSLMRRSICVMNPSLFEGYGLSVDEAKALCVPVIASDLASHREIAHPNCQYFDPNDVVSLARELKKAWISLSAGPRDESLEKYQDMRETSARRCQSAFADGVLSLIGQNCR